MSETNNEADAILRELVAADDACADSLFGKQVAAAYERARRLRDAAWTRARTYCEAAAPQAGWIPISESLPAINESVALLNADRWENTCDDDHQRNVQSAGYLSQIGAQKFWGVRGERALELNAFTHWMPLPPAPTETPAAIGAAMKGTP